MLKKTLILLAVAIVAVSSCKKEDENQPPSKPKLLTPAKGAAVAPESITFTWEASTDAESEKVEYSLSLSSDSASWQRFVAGRALAKPSPTSREVAATTPLSMEKSTTGSYLSIARTQVVM